MPVTLAEAERGARSDYDATIINEFRSNPLLDLMIFDDVVNPAGGGATLTYGYRRAVSLSTAAFRAINSEYTPDEAVTAEYSTRLKPLGGSYQIDRVLAELGPAAANEVAFQSSMKIRAAQSLFGDAVINGDSAVDANSFDGLSKALTGSSTESTTAIDLSAGITTMAGAFAVLGMLDDLISQMDGAPTAILANTKLVNIIKMALRYANQNVSEAADRASYGAVYGGARIIDAGFKQNGTTAVIPVNVTDPDSAGPLTAGSTSIYAVRIALDGFHGVSVAGRSVVRSFPPDFTTPGAVKTGEVELGPVGVALKATRAAAVMRNVKVQ